jgi:hypothetical protein
MKKMKSKVIYHGGSIPVPSYLQKGSITIDDDTLLFGARGKESRYDIDIRVPFEKIIGARAEERKYYSSVGYFLIIEYKDENDKKQELELEVRAFLRRGRALAISQWWAENLSTISGGKSG